MSIANVEGLPVFTLGDYLRKAREHAGLEVQQLAAELGVSRNTITNYERGRVTPRRPVLMAWAMRTGVPLEWLESLGATNPRQDDDPDGGSVVRHQGLEPRTRCFGAPRHLVAAGLSVAA